MSTHSKVTVTVLLLAAVMGLAGVDAFMNRRELTAYLPGDAESPDVSQTPEGVTVQQDPDIAQVIATQGLVTVETSESSLLEQIIQGKAAVFDFSILKDDDRIGSVTWTTSSQVKTWFIALKEALLPAFSPQVRNVRDTTEAVPGHPVRNVLRFTDPGLGEDSFAFVRTLDRLYEFHIRTGREEVMQAVIDALTQ